MGDRDKKKRLLDKIEEAVQAGDYRLTKHARERMDHRGINLPEIRYVLGVARIEKRYVGRSVSVVKLLGSGPYSR